MPRPTNGVGLDHHIGHVLDAVHVGVPRSDERRLLLEIQHAPDEQPAFGGGNRLDTNRAASLVANRRHEQR